MQTRRLLIALGLACLLALICGITLLAPFESLASPITGTASATGKEGLPTPSATPACGPGWSVVPSPNVGTLSNAFDGVSAVASNDVWAVGYSYDSSSRELALVQHWDGSAWSVVSATQPGQSSRLKSVSALSANNVWAVGYYVGGTTRTLIEHWNGTAWTVIPSPNTGDCANYLQSVTAIAANDVWAVGYYLLCDNTPRTLTMHWDGAAWTVITSPNIGTLANRLTGVDAISSGDVWAVGMYNQGSDDAIPMGLHWNGTSWSSVPMPGRTGFADNIFGVAAVSPNDVWAVGYSFNDQGATRSLIEHWDGTSWSIATSPMIGSDKLRGVSARAANDVWAVGESNNQTLTLHWDGTRWAAVPSANVGPSFLTAVDIVSANDVWAVGLYTIGANTSRTFTEHFAGPLCVTATPPATFTPDRSATVTPTATPGCGASWNIVPSPNNSTRNNYLNDVASLAANDAWAVGGYLPATGGAQTLAQHWDGTSWSIVASLPPGQGSGFSGVAAVASNDVWAVGSYQGVTQTVTLIGHWDGSQWAAIPSPNVGQYANSLSGITAISANDIWAVGHYRLSNTSMQTLTLHWDGISWSVVTSPNFGSQSNTLTGVSAVSTNAVWAVGWYRGGVDSTLPLTMRWNGTAWNIVSVPVLGEHNAELYEVSALSANDAWAVGYSFNGNLMRTLILHWDGSAWSRDSSPNPSSGFNRLNAVDARASNDVWAVGYYESSGPWRTSILHWDGSSWYVVPSPNASLGDNSLRGVDAAPGGVWAVGFQEVGSNIYQTQVQRYENLCPTVTVSPVTTSTPSRTPTGITTATATPTCTAWEVVPNANPPTTGNRLVGVEAIAADDVWAVGNTITNNQQQTYIEHWNGSAWSLVASPNVGTGRNYLQDISGLSANDIWAAGVWAEEGGPYHPLIIHWDGVSWEVSTAPTPGTGDNELYAIEAIAPNDVWAVGQWRNGFVDPFQTLFMHWDGTAWSQVTGANPGSASNQLYDVSGSSADDVWASGLMYDGSQTSPLVEHWDGAQWSAVSVPQVGTGVNWINAVEAIAPNDAWAVGYYFDTGVSRFKTLTLHWNGTQWGLIASPNMGDYDHTLEGVVALAPDDVWAVGSYGTNCTDFCQFTLVMHWDGTAWSIVSSGNVPTGNNFLEAVDAASTNDLWAVGRYFDNHVARALSLHYTSACVTPTATPVVTSLATNTPVLTSTSVVGTSTAQATATACAIEFTDVPQGSTFYPYVRCLACRGILGGYSDDTFRPNNDITRGQISKIVANSAGFSEPVAGQTFEDVPPSNTFFPHVQRMVGRGIITGYPCGGTGEPCGTDNRPYFRPNANATRAQ
ncbi:MAG TPA: S-layer homology domain-containing protein, partial [Chloroflexia bacterium]|nr:S-layer homology domain-containing protein [Chloroflexia bacterium]